MKNIIKISLITLLIGAVLFGTGIAIRGFKPFAVFFDNGKIQIDEGSNNNITLDKTEVDSFTYIDVSINVGDINIIPSDKYAVEYSLDADKVNYKVENDTLFVITDKKNKSGLSFMNSPECYLNIYVPSDADFNDVSLMLNVGDTNVDSIKATSFDISSDVGDITISKCSASNSATIHASTGDINVTGGEYSILDIDSDTGDVTCNLKSISSCLKIASAVGDVEATLPEGTYNIDLSTDVGDININGKSTGDGVGKSYKENGNGPVINIKSDVGDIDFNY